MAIDGVLTSLEEALLGRDAEIIVVDDGSIDCTSQIVRMHERVTLIRHRRNRGYGFTIKTGIRAAKGEIVAWYDSDGQHRPEDLMKVIRKMEEEDLDYCIGVRGKDSYIDKTRVVGKMILRLFVKYVAGGRTGGFNSGLRAFKRSVICKYLRCFPNDSAPPPLLQS